MTGLETLLAQGGTINLQPGQGLATNLEGLTISQLVGGVIILLLIGAALIFFFMLLLGGIKYITSGGDKAQTEAARGQITAALIGLVIVFAAWAIVNLIQIFFGVNILQLNVPEINTIGTTP